MKDYEQKDDLYSLLRSCGHYLHHSAASAQDPELFRALNEQQKNELKETLKLLRKSWKSD